MVFDDAAFGTSRLGPVADTHAPTVPANVDGDRDVAVLGAVSWDASTDARGVTAYDVFRDGTMLASLGSRDDLHGHDRAVDVDALVRRYGPATGGEPIGVDGADLGDARPRRRAGLFADGFESGTLGAWTTSAGLAVRERGRPVRWLRGRGQHHERQHLREEDPGRRPTPTGTRRVGVRAQEPGRAR